MIASATDVPAATYSKVPVAIASIDLASLFLQTGR